MRIYIHTLPTYATTDDLFNFIRNYTRARLKRCQNGCNWIGERREDCGGAGIWIWNEDMDPKIEWSPFATDVEHSERKIMFWIHGLRTRLKWKREQDEKED